MVNSVVYTGMKFIERWTHVFLGLVGVLVIDTWSWSNHMVCIPLNG